MKRLSLLIVAILTIAFTTNVFGQKAVETPIKDYTWGVYNHPHIVAKNSSYTYGVERHYTYTFAQLKEKVAGTLPTTDKGENNRYAWEIQEVTWADDAGTMKYTPKVGGYKVTFADDDARYVGAKITDDSHQNTYVWKDAEISGVKSGNFYLVRVSEYANHKNDGNNSSKAADKASKVVSEIIVKIGDEIQIYIPDQTEQADYFYCYQDGDKDNKDIFLNNIDTKAGLTQIKFNGRSRVLASGVDGYIFKLDLTKLKQGDPASAEVITFEVPKTDVNYLATEGYYTYDFGLVKINALLQSNTPKKSIDINALTTDIFYTVAIKGFVHGDSVDENTFTDFDASTAITNAVIKAKKADRTYGFYTKPVITKINHNK